MMAMSGTVETISFAVRRRNSALVDGPLRPELLPRVGGISATGRTPADEEGPVTMSLHPPSPS